MIAVQVDTNGFEEKIRRLVEMPDIIRKVVAGALSETTDDLHTRLKLEVQQNIDRPTRYVTGGLKKRQIRGRNGVGVERAGVYWEFFPAGRSPEDIMRPHVFGGTRSQKAHERRLTSASGLIPAGTYAIMGRDYPRDKHGNITGARYSQMLSSLGTISEAARSQLPKASQRNRKGVSYYVHKRGGVPVAIVERKGEGRTVMVMLTTKAPVYRKRPMGGYFQAAQKQVNYSLPLHFNRILNRYASRL